MIEDVFNNNFLAIFFLDSISFGNSGLFKRQIRNILAEMVSKYLKRDPRVLIGTEPEEFMLDKLIESTDNGKQTKKMRRMLLGIGTVMSLAFVCGLILSIFSTTLALGGGEIDLTRLVAPAIPENAPPPEVEEREVTSKVTTSKSVLPTRVINMQRTDEAPITIPKNVSDTRNKYKARTAGPMMLSDRDSEGTYQPGNSANGIPATGGKSSFVKPPTQVVVEKSEELTVKDAVPEPPKLAVKKPQTIVTSDLVNGKAINLVQPVVSDAIRTLGLKGPVRITVLINEKGRVISATAGSGHKLLTQPAITAARRSTFSPTILNGTPVKVRGVILYNYK